MFIKVIRLKTIILLMILTISLTAGIILYYEKGTPISVFAPHNNELTLVIDAGHGGIDGGAIGADGTSEQFINLSIAKSTEALAGFFGINTVMTRENEDSLDYKPGNSIHKNKVADIKKRESIVSALKNPIFLSIHLNQFDDPQYKGAQVFFSNNNPDGELLAKSLQESVILGLDKGNKRRAKQANSGVYLMKKLKCPAVIVECGFVSNPEELQKLTDVNYQKRTAVCIMRGYLNYLQKSDNR